LDIPVSSASIERVTYDRPEQLPGLEVLYAENSRTRWCVYHHTYDICAITGDGGGGHVEWQYRGAPHTAHAADVAIMEPGEVHRTTRMTAAGTFHVLMLNPELVRQIAAEIGVSGCPHFRAAIVRSPLLFQQLAALPALLRAPGTTRLEVQSAVVNCVADALAIHGEQRIAVHRSAPRRGLEAARELIHAAFEENLSLDVLAHAAGLSRFHFLRSFARTFGLPPHAYQVRLRVQKARTLLAAGAPLAEIDAGFADQSHLIRHFRKIVGVTPMRYVAMVRRGEVRSSATPLSVG
jgi:AraC-like DNA-binding protein